MVINNGIRLTGKYNIELLSSDMRTKREVEVDNLITDVGLNSLLVNDSSNNWGGTFLVGTGTAAPAVSDTSLQNQLASKSITNAYDAYATSPYSSPYARRGVLFTETEAVGTISEVGVRSSVSGTPLFSRAIIDPPIQKLNGDFLLCTYTLTPSNAGGTYSQYNVTDNRSDVWTVRSIINNYGLAYMVWSYTSNYRWSSNHFTSCRVGINNTTAPDVTHINCLENSSSVGPPNSSDIVFTAHNGPSGGTYMDVRFTFVPGVATGTIKEFVVRGYSGSSLYSGSSRHTFDNGSGDGLVKGSGDLLRITIRYTFSR